MSLLLTLSWTTVCLFLMIRAEDTFDCTGYEDDSFHPIYDADDCRHYWHCIYVDTVYMHAVRRVCPSGTEFDSVLRQCETSSLVSSSAFRRRIRKVFFDFLSGHLCTSEIAPWTTNEYDDSSMEMAILSIVLSQTLENNDGHFVHHS